MTRREWTPDEDDLLDALAAAGKKLAAIAKRLRRRVSSVQSRLASRGDDDPRTDGRARRAPARPTDALPGTAEKIAALAARVARGEGLWHPKDRRAA